MRYMRYGNHAGCTHIEYLLLVETLQFSTSPVTPQHLTFPPHLRMEITLLKAHMHILYEGPWL